MDAPVDATWDAGDEGCVRLAIELRRRVEALPPGGRLEVLARDSGARTDIPAWCRMTGHTLVVEEPPRFVIRRGA